MKTKLVATACAILASSVSSLSAWTIVPNNSASPTVILVGDNVTLSRSGTCSNGFAWSEATLWYPTGTTPDDYVIGDVYVNPSQQTFQTPQSGTTGTALGTYSIQNRLVDVDYNYVDQWLTINGNWGINVQYVQAGLGYQEIGAYDYSEDSSITSFTVYVNGAEYVGASGGGYWSAIIYNYGPTYWTSTTVVEIVSVDDTGTHTRYSTVGDVYSNHIINFNQ